MGWLLLSAAFASTDALSGAASADVGLPAATPPVEAGPLHEDEEGAGGALPVDPVGDAASAVLPEAVLAPIERGPETWTPPEELLEAVRAVRDRPIGERVEAASRAFLGLPYLNDAAGELTAEDPDPPARYDTFDCLTFVEEVLGLAMAGDPLHAPAIRNALRYRGTPSYAARRHFMEAQWIPDAIANGLLEDITARVGRARVLRKNVTLDLWKNWSKRAFWRIPDALLPVGEWSLSYLDLLEAVEAAPRIPAGALVVTLRAERRWKPIVVTHISMVVPPSDEKWPGELRMRHATRMGLQTVRDDRLAWYMEHLRDYTNWPSLGVTILMPREQGPRISALNGPVLPPAFPPAEGEIPLFKGGVSWGGGASPPATPPLDAPRPAVPASDGPPTGAP